MTYAALGLYAGGVFGAMEELRRVVAGTTFVCLVLTASVFFLQHMGPYSRGLLILSGVLYGGRGSTGPGAGAAPVCFAPVVGHSGHCAGCGGRGRGVDRPVALPSGDGSAAGGLSKGECAGVPVAGPLSMAPVLARALKIRHALVAIPGVDREDLVWMLDDWGTVFRHVILIPNLFGIASLWVAARDLGGVLGLELRQNLLVPLNRWTKRALDIAGALIFGALALPVLAAAALWIKLTSGGPLIYRQEREGEGGRRLQVLKLRTMHMDAEALLMRVLSGSPQARAEWAVRFKLKKDPRVLPGVGSFLRKTSLDELPQLWSVLKGEMSLVGPRPFPRYHLDGFGPRFRALRSRVKPGLTGLWQVSDRADGNLEVQEALDTYYIRNWSLWLDLYILARTVRAVLFPRGAY